MRNSKGFTVMELAVVLTIACILSGIAIHTLSASAPGKHLSGAVAAFQNDLTRARMEALKNGRQYKVAVSGSDYTLSMGDKAAGSTVWTADTTGSLPYPDVTFDSASGDFTFDPRGTASQTADIVLKNGKGETRTLSVTVAGRIRSS